MRKFLRKKSIPNTDVILRVRMSLTHTYISARWVELKKKVDIDQKENLIWKNKVVNISKIDLQTDCRWGIRNANIFKS